MAYVENPEQYRLYELFQFADGNDDILSDMPPQDAVDTRQGMWAQVPYSVGDGSGVINEDFINFVSNRESYPNRALTTMPYLMERFNECMGNLKEVLNHVENKKRFFKNLLKLQEYLISQNSYDKEPIVEEQYEINEADIPPVSNSLSVLDNEVYARHLASQAATKMGIGLPRQDLGGGSKGRAFEINDNLVMKITSDPSEADAGFKIMRNKPKTLADVYEIYKLVDTTTNPNYSFFIIMQENIKEKPESLFWQYDKVIHAIKPNGMNMGDIFMILKRRGEKFDYNEVADLPQRVLTDNPQVMNVSPEDRQGASKFLAGILAIKMDLWNNNINSKDYSNYQNLGYKNGVLTFFDIGDYKVEEPAVAEKNVIYLPEGQENLDETYNKVTADRVANEIAQQKGYNAPQYMKSGTFGAAYDIGNDRVLKITGDKSEAKENSMLIGKQLKYIAQPYNVFVVKSKQEYTIPETYAIVIEKLRTDEEAFGRMFDRMDSIFGGIFRNISFADAIEFYLYGHQFESDVDKNKIENYFKKNSQDAEFFFSILRIAEELETYGIKSIDYYNPSNLGYKKNGVIAFFDIGGSNDDEEPEIPEIQVTEDSTSKFSQDNSIGRDDFPPYEQNDTSPMTDNNIPTTNEELEFIGGGETTDDTHELNEKIEDANYHLDRIMKHILPYEGNPVDQINLVKRIAKEIFNDFLALKKAYFDGDKVAYKENMIKIFNHIREEGFKFHQNVLINPVDHLQQLFSVLGFLEDKDRSAHFEVMQEVLEELINGQQNISERDKSFMPKSSSVEVKKKCRLGGLGGTSAACNQGDINNLNIKPMNEEAIPRGRSFWAWVSPDNEFIEIEPMGHMDYIRTIYPNIRGESKYEKGLSDGWVRVMYGDNERFDPRNDNELSLEGRDKNRVKEVVKNVFYDLVKNGKVHIYADYQKGNGDIINPDDEKGKANLVNYISEEIDANEIYGKNSNKTSVITVLRGKRDVGFVILTKEIANRLEKANIGVIPVRMISNKEMRAIIYRKNAVKDAFRLYDITKTHNGTLDDQSAEEAREIGKLLGYTDLSIEGYIRKHYPSNVPVMPDKSPDDFNDMDEEISPEFEKQIEKDAVTHDLDKAFIRAYKDEDETVNIYGVNGDEVRDDGFIEWVEGGNHYVDVDSPENEQKYAKWIPENEIWVDDVHMSKPNDMEAIILHERIERDLIKYFGYTYGDAHEIANKAETLFRKKVPEGTGESEAEEISTLIHAAFKKNLKKKHGKQNESVIFADMNEANMALPKGNLVRDIEKLGGKLFSVGGAVRDEFLGKESKDLDLLITGIPMDELEKLLSKYGRVDAVGKSFGVLKFKPKGWTEDIDVAIPRTEKPTAIGGHKGFDVTSDHALPIEKDLERRDFTINAIAKDSEGNLIDPFGGQEDLKNKIIRVVNPEAFSDDPLRMLRGVQFASRFDFTIEPQTMKMIQDNAEKIKTISPERILGELDKIVKKGNAAIGVKLLADTGLFEQIFGNKIKPSRIARRNFYGVKTMAEFIFLMTNGVVRDPAEFFKNNLKGDLDSYKEMKALDLAFNSFLLDEDMSPIKARSVAHNMYSISPKSFESEILPQRIETAVQELKSGKYPKTIGELTVNGNDLMALGLKGKEIGEALKMMLLRIYSDSVDNNKEKLLALLPKKELKEFSYPELRDERKNTWVVDGQEVDIKFFLQKYDEWNQGERFRDPSKESILRFLEDEFPELVDDEKLKREINWELNLRDLLNEAKTKTESEPIEPFEFDPATVSDSKWQVITNGLTKIGYASRPYTDWKEFFNKYGKTMIPTASIDDDKTRIIKKVLTPRGPLSDDTKVIAKAKRHFGTTTNFNEAGYILLDGSMLNFSGAKFGGSPNRRDIDHRQVNEIGSDMISFMKMGNIRLQSYGFEMTKMPTKQQFNTLYQFIRRGDGYVVVDFASEDIVHVEHSVEYNKGTNTNRIINDIINYYRDGTKPVAPPIREEASGNVAYSAVVLDKESHDKLVKVFKPMIPEGWEILAHHMTLNMGGIDRKYKRDLNTGVLLTVIDYAIDDKVMAVGVEGYPTNNEKPHITLAVNRQGGGKPKMSNNLTEWKPMEFPLKLTGKVTEVKR